MLYVFVRFEAKPGCEAALKEELGRVIEPTRAEPGCIRIHIYQSVGDAALYFIHSVWADPAAFERHAGLPHTVRFLAAVAALITHPLQAARTNLID
jgi:quinol monooxygenase YgiN